MVISGPDHTSVGWSLSINFLYWLLSWERNRVREKSKLEWSVSPTWMGELVLEKVTRRHNSLKTQISPDRTWGQVDWLPLEVTGRTLYSPRLPPSHSHGPEICTGWTGTTKSVLDLRDPPELVKSNFTENNISLRKNFNQEDFQTKTRDECLKTFLNKISIRKFR